jgi:hypothetical protein
MTEDQPPENELESYRKRAADSDKGGRGRGRRTRVGTGGDDDEALFDIIMQALKTEAELEEIIPVDGVSRHDTTSQRAGRRWKRNG